MVWENSLKKSRTASIPRYMNHPLVKGTFFLSLAGILSRIIGFLFRIFFSRNFGAEAMGIYQMILPILALSYAFTSSGLQTAISKLVAEHTDNASEQHKQLYTGICLSLFLSALACGYLYFRADYLSIHLLNEPQTASLLRIGALSIPLAAIHGCVCGYFYGIKKAFVPAISQLLEQLVRVGSICFLFYIIKGNNREPSINLIALGLTFGEAASMLFSLLFFCLSPSVRHVRMSPDIQSIKPGFKRGRALLGLAIPLCSTRIAIHFLQSIEASALPACLVLYGYTHSESLSLYGILTGMSLPVVLLPTVLTGSIAVMLLPIISEAKSTGNLQKVKTSIELSIRYSLYAGSVCTLLFCILGKSVGSILFHNELSGHYIQVLGFLCPFMYIAGTLTSIMNGLGKTVTTFFISNLSMLVRLAMVYFFVPVYGMEGYLWTILASQILQTLLCVIYCKQVVIRRVDHRSNRKSSPLLPSPTP